MRASRHGDAWVAADDAFVARGTLDTEHRATVAGSRGRNTCFPDGSSDALMNPKDPLNIKVSDPSIRGHTSQFIHRCRKPAK